MEGGPLGLGLGPALSTNMLEYLLKINLNSYHKLVIDLNFIALKEGVFRVNEIA